MQTILAATAGTVLAAPQGYYLPPPTPVASGSRQLTSEQFVAESKDAADQIRAIAGLLTELDLGEFLGAFSSGQGDDNALEGVGKQQLTRPLN